MNEYQRSPITAYILEKYNPTIAKTQNNGYHIYLFTDLDVVPGSEKLAMSFNKQGKKETIIETRGEGAYVIAPTTTGYSFINMRQIKTNEVIPEDDVNILLDFGRSFNEIPEVHSPNLRRGRNFQEAEGTRPGFLFNNSSEALHRVSEVLKSNGWTHTNGIYWRRPGKKKGVSATLNFKNSGLFHVFTSSAQFEPNKAYSPFAVLTILDHNGDYAACSSYLASIGYISPNNKKIGKNDLQATKSKTPAILPNDYFNRLPVFLQDIIAKFDDNLSKNLIYISSLVILSHIFSKVKGKYDKQRVSPNIYSFIVMPASSGKGVMNWTKLLLNKFEEIYWKIYKFDKENYENAINNGENPKGKAPRRRYSTLSANSSIASLMDDLLTGEGKGVLFDSEADVFSRNKGEKWGDFSSELRKGFHHEDMTLSRKNQDRIEIKSPEISVLLSGTLKQVSRLMPDEEDGLFSRFLFFFRTEFSSYRNPFNQNNDTDLSTFFIEQSKILYDFSQAIPENNNFRLTEEQIQLFAEFAQKTEDKYREGKKSVLFPTARRGGLIVFRVAMILTILRHMDCIPVEPEFICADEDLELAIELFSTLLVHAENVLENIYKRDIGLKHEQFYKLLPSNFTRSDAIELGKNEMNVRLKSVENYLTTLIKEGLLKTDQKGNYEKIQKL